MPAALRLRIRLTTSRINTLMQTHADTRTCPRRSHHDGFGHGLLRAWATPAQLLLLPR